MNLLKRIPGTQRSPSGLEWRVFKRLPVVLFLGTAAPLLLMLLAWLAAPAEGTAQESAQGILIYQLAGVLMLHWTLVLTVAIGCVVVLVMKGPGYVADPYPMEGPDHRN